MAEFALSFKTEIKLVSCLMPAAHHNMSGNLKSLTICLSQQSVLCLVHGAEAGERWDGTGGRRMFS